MKYIALILAISLSPLAYADYEPEAIIKYRHDMMEAIKGHNNAIKAIVNGTVPFDNQLGMHMQSLKDLFGQIDSLFPEGSDFGETHAKDEIWDKPEKFRETVDRANEALAKFERVVRQGSRSAARSAFKEFGKASCGNCHKLFRKKEEHDH